MWPSQNIQTLTLKADGQAFRTANFSIKFSHGLNFSQLTIQLVGVFQNVWKLKYNIKVTTYSMLLPDVGIVKILLSCFTIPIATIFIATFIRDSLIAFVEFYFSKVTGTFWHWGNILERRLKSVHGNLEKKSIFSLILNIMFYIFLKHLKMEWNFFCCCIFWQKF